MKLRKVLLLTAATAALGSMNVISAFADAVVVEEDGSIRRPQREPQIRNPCYTAGPSRAPTGCITMEREIP